MRSFIFSLFICIGLYAPQALGATYTLQTDPPHPQPDEPFVVSLQSQGGGASSIAWFINGSEFTQGSNDTQITVPGVGLGKQTNIVARVSTVNGMVTETRTDITPLRVDVHISANTYTPAFYAGRALPTSGSTITATALVFSANGNATNAYTYRWKLDGRALQGGMALSQNSIRFTPDFEDSLDLQVEVITQAGKVVATTDVAIPIVEPKIHFYEKNPLRGLSLISLPDPYTLLASQTVIKAEPYYMDITADDADLHMEWELNGAKAESAGARNEISLERNGNSGQAFVTFHVRNLKQLLQGVKESFTVQF